MPSLVPVKGSSNVYAYSYDPQVRTLYVQFLEPPLRNRPGPLYRYRDVPLGVFRRFERAPSKGKYIHMHIKGHFHYGKWTGTNWRTETVLKKNSAEQKRLRERFGG
ncbi:MAG: KTSC domain-containing protein [Anaerolineaceae bacterium]|nr:KTSC domain-containing protein [Anaerolineaceae bacterium]